MSLLHGVNGLTKFLGFQGQQGPGIDGTVKRVVRVPFADTMAGLGHLVCKPQAP